MRPGVILLLAVMLLTRLFNDQLGEFDDDFDHTAGGIVGGAPTALVIVGHGGGELASWSPSGASGGVRTIRCGYYALQGVDGTYEYGVDLDAPVTPEHETAYAFVCQNERDVRIRFDIVVFDAGDPFAGMFAEERALDLALASLELPTPIVEVNPPADVDHLVGLATWVWHGGGWDELTATATVAGVSATVRARPVSLEVDPGDGSSPFRCDGPGEPYRSGSASSCSHTWVNRSTTIDPHGSFELAVTTRWVISWEGSNGGGGELGELSSSDTVDVRVLEAQAMINYR